MEIVFSVCKGRKNYRGGQIVIRILWLWPVECAKQRSWADECEDRGEQSADIHEQHNGPIDVDGHRFKIVSGRVESKQSPLALCKGNAERKDVADE